MPDSDIVSIASRLELFVDEFLVKSFQGGASLRLHHPQRENIALVCEKPWEGNMCGYITVLQDDDLYRMYYRGWKVDLSQSRGGGERLQQVHGQLMCLAESSDGIVWSRPTLGQREFDGSKENYIILLPQGAEDLHGFAPFADRNPNSPHDWNYKAVGATGLRGGLFALRSSDGIRWELMSHDPVITGCAFDSQNLAFWDEYRGEYRAYVRDFREGRRDIRTCTSRDFIHWTEPEWLEYPGAAPEQLYTNQVIPYFRAPHILVGFPTRYTDYDWTPSIEALPELEHRRIRSNVNKRFGTALTDGLFMASRDGRTFHRWGDAFIRPGPQIKGNWTYGDNYQCLGIIETPSRIQGAPRELSLFASEHYWRDPGTIIRRFTLRVDGFAFTSRVFNGRGTYNPPSELLWTPTRFELFYICSWLCTRGTSGPFRKSNTRLRH